MAQLVEQLIRNQQVAGSSPAISSNRKATSHEVAFLLERIVGCENSLQAVGNALVCSFLVQLAIPSLLGGVQSPVISSDRKATSYEVAFLLK